jgi:hypothetical protein
MHRHVYREKARTQGALLQSTSAASNLARSTNYLSIGAKSNLGLSNEKAPPNRDKDGARAGPSAMHPHELRCLSAAPQ